MIIPLLLITLLSTAIPAAENVTIRKSSYQINSRGFRVGEMKTSTQPLFRKGQRLIHFKSTTKIDANFLFYSKQSICNDEAVVGVHGPVEFHHSRLENGSLREVEAKFAESQVRLEIKEGGKSRSAVFSRDRYDFTTMDCAEMSLGREGDRKEIRLLDLENSRIESRKYHWLKSEEVTIGGKKILCRVVDFEDQENRCRRWITRDGKGILIARQEGKGNAGSYVLKIVSLTES